MRRVMMLAAGLALAACSGFRHIGGADGCYAPTEREARITQRVWK